MTPPLDRIDHLHVYVADRPAAVAWYHRVLGLAPVPALAHWAADGGPLTVANAAGTVNLALFERPRQACRSTIAFGVGAAAFNAWRRHLAAELGQPPTFEDHGQTWSVYFHDPDGNPYEVTCDDVAALRAASDDASSHCAAQ